MLPYDKTPVVLQELLLPDNTSPYSIWFNALDSVTAAKVRVALARIEQGNLSKVKWFKGIGACRIHWGPGLRVYLARDGVDVILLLGGGDKHRQQADIDLALERWEQYKRRKKEGKK